MRGREAHPGSAGCRRPSLRIRKSSRRLQRLPLVPQSPLRVRATAHGAPRRSVQQLSAPPRKAAHRTPTPSRQQGPPGEWGRSGRGTTEERLTGKARGRRTRWHHLRRNTAGSREEAQRSIGHQEDPLRPFSDICAVLRDMQCGKICCCKNSVILPNTFTVIHR